MALSADQYRRLVESSPDGILLVRNSVIEFLNPAAASLFGASDPAQILGKSAWDLFHADSHPVIRPRLEQLLRGEVPPPVEEKIVRLDGSVGQVEVNSTLKDKPEEVNTKPHASWMIVLKLADPHDAGSLLDADQYAALVG